jgi:hypothetical protein
MNYICECCDYKTNNKSSYEKHLKSNKHLKNEKNKVKEESDDMPITDEEDTARIAALIYPKPEFNKERTLNHIEDEGRHLLYMEAGNKEGNKEELIMDSLLNTYYERKYEIDSFKNIYKNDSLLKLSMLIYVYKNYLEVSSKYDELKEIAAGMAEEYKHLDLIYELTRMKLKRSEEEILRLKAYHNQTQQNRPDTSD